MEKTSYCRKPTIALRWALIVMLCSASAAMPISAQPREETLFRGDETPLMKASAHGQVGAMRQLLTRGAAVDTRNGVGLTALMLAAWSGQEAAVVVLLDAGADQNVRSRIGETALIQAVWSGNLPTMRALVTRGAKVNLMDSYGGTALQLAAGLGNEAAAQLLLGAGADVGARRNGPINYAALHYAAWSGNGRLFDFCSGPGRRSMIQRAAAGRRS